MLPNSRLRSWPLIVGAFIAVFGIDVGVGIALGHRKTRARLSPAALVADQGHRRARQRAVEMAKPADSARVRAEQQREWMQECEDVYRAPSTTTDPKWDDESAVRGSCVAAVSNGVSPDRFRTKQGP
jgi:hypothetical protein